MLDGRDAIFISCSEGYKKKVAYPFRDAIEATGGRAIIVSDAPRLGKAFSPEQKVKAYLKVSDAVLVLATPDDRIGSGRYGTRANIADELGRARSKRRLRDRICVFKEPRVRMHSNVDPAYERLDLKDLPSAIDVALRQLRAWGLTLSPSATRPSAPIGPAGTPANLTDLKIEEPAKTAAAVRDVFRTLSKSEQRTYVTDVINVVDHGATWDFRAVAAQVLEYVTLVDPNLVSWDAVERLARHPDFSVRSSAAVILFYRARDTPGLVPLDLVELLAAPSREDWYVYTPAIATLKMLLLGRQEAAEIIESLATSSNQTDREYAAVVLRDVARVKPAVVPILLVRALQRDGAASIARIAAETSSLISAVSDAGRAHHYAPFSPF
jgi:hypothetical protein